jgi:hypothetical protein
MIEARGKDANDDNQNSDDDSKCKPQDNKSDSSRASAETRLEEQPVLSGESDFSLGSQDTLSSSIVEGPPGLTVGDSVAYVHMQAPPPGLDQLTTAETAGSQAAPAGPQAPGKTNPQRRNKSSKPMPPGLVQGSGIPKNLAAAQVAGTPKASDAPPAGGRGKLNARRRGRQERQGYGYNQGLPMANVSYGGWEMEPLSIPVADDMGFCPYPPPLMMPPLWPPPPLFNPYAGAAKVEDPMWPELAYYAQPF